MTSPGRTIRIAHRAALHACSPAPERTGNPNGQAPLLALSVFFLLMSYSLVKPAREALLATPVEGFAGAELRATATLMQGLLIFALVGISTSLADRLSRRTLVTAIDAAFVVFLAGVALWTARPQAVQAAWMPVAIYIGTGAFGAIVIAQFWAFATDLEGRRAGRLLPLLALSASLGGATGAYAARRVIELVSVPTVTLFLAAAVALCVAAALAAAADRRPALSTPVTCRALPSTRRRGLRGSLEQFATHRYLLTAALLTLLTQWVSTNGEHLLFGLVQRSLRTAVNVPTVEQVMGGTMAFYASFSLWSSVAALVVQVVVACGCVRGRSGRNLLLVLPLVTLAASAAMLVVPALGWVKYLKVAENATRYSIHNTAAQLLWLPTTAEMKYKAKVVVETVVVRLADGLAALTAFIGIRLLQAPLQSLVLFNLALGLVWVVLAAVLVREQRRRLRTAPAVAVFPKRTAPPPQPADLSPAFAA